MNVLKKDCTNKTKQNVLYLSLSSEILKIVFLPSQLWLLSTVRSIPGGLHVKQFSGK